MTAAVLAMGLSHHSAPLAVREQLALSQRELPGALRSLRSYCNEGVILSTCNRTEIYAVAPSHKEGRAGVADFIARYFQVAPGEVDPYVYTHTQGDAARHLFRVAAGLDSMVLGEAEILGQVKDALHCAQTAQATGKVTHRLFTQAVHAGKRARAETGIGAHALSVSHVAVAQAQRLFGDLSPCVILVISAGEMGRLAARILAECGCTHLVVANRTYERAAQLAQRLNGRAVALPDLPQALAQADIVLTATDSHDYILTFEAVQSALSARGGRPLFLIDIAVPRDVDPRAAALPGVHLFNIDNLGAVDAANLHARQREVARVEAIVDAEVERFLGWYRALDVEPIIAALRAKVEEVRQEELARALRRLAHLAPQDQAQIDALTMSIINKILHQHFEYLKSEGDVELVRNLFHLEDEAYKA
ncbi:MAG: glutamyl-tRNA reductase [Chloroflexi bacterium]|nr:glutamyl-tRNA reductase [Chloroflexota bacterium]